MKFYCIVEENNNESKKRYSLLKTSCEKKDIDFCLITPNTFHYTKDKIIENSMMYRATRGDKSRLLEKYFLSKPLATLYSKNGIFDRNDSFFFNKKLNLPIIKTVPDFISNEDSLADYVTYLKGFPLIVKVTGGSHGVGVIKIDSMESLKSIRDYLKNESGVILRQFIKHKQQGRLIVLGDQVIASHINYSTVDFRTNVGSNKVRKRKAFTFTQNIQEIAIKAVASLGLEFAGVDILIEEKTGEPYIAEINFPCFFPTDQQLSNVPISDLIIEHLIKKLNKQTK